MNYDTEISELDTRIRKAESDRDLWRAAGEQEKYMECYVLAEALELERGRLCEQHIRASASGRPS